MLGSRRSIQRITGLRLPGVGRGEVELRGDRVAVGLGNVGRAHQASDLAGGGRGGITALVFPPLARGERCGVPICRHEVHQEVGCPFDVRPSGGVRAAELVARMIGSPTSSSSVL